MHDDEFNASIGRDLQRKFSVLRKLLERTEPDTAFQFEFKHIPSQGSHDELSFMCVTASDRGYTFSVLPDAKWTDIQRVSRRKAQRI